MKEDKEKKGGRGIEERERNERIKGKKKEKDEMWFSRTW